MFLSYGRAVVAEALDRLGVVYRPPTGGAWLLGTCPLHDDRHPSLAVHVEDGAWRCYAGCGGGADLADLVARATGDTVAEVRRALRAADSTGIRRALDRPPGSSVVASPVPDLTYDRTRVPRYLLRRGFDLATLRAWRAGTSSDGRAAIPVTAGGRVVGLVRRSVDGRAPKYLNTLGVETGRTLFGLDLVRPEERRVVVVEGPLDAMWLYQHGYGAVALLGSSLTEPQAAALRRRYWTVVLLLDADAAGRRGAVEAARALRGLDVRLARLPEGRDPQDCDLATLTAAVEEAEPVAEPRKIYRNLGKGRSARA